MIKTVSAKLANMRKPQEFVIYPDRGDGTVLVQSDKSIGQFDKATGKGLLNTKGCYFVHLHMRGVIEYQFPEDFVKACIAAIPQPGDEIGPGIIVG